MSGINNGVNIRAIFEEKNIKRTQICKYFILVSGPNVYNSFYNVLRTWYMPIILITK